MGSVLDISHDMNTKKSINLEANYEVDFESRYIAKGSDKASFRCVIRYCKWQQVQCICNGQPGGFTTHCVVGGDGNNCITQCGQQTHDCCPEL